MNVLLLAGGESTRMGTPKHTLHVHGGKPVYVHLLEQLIAACPDADVYMSLREKHQRINIQTTILGRPVRLIYDVDAQLDASLSPIGPATGLLAAYSTDPVACWLVLACDYPLMSTRELQALCAVYKDPLTCFMNAEGFFEPFVGIWSPTALEQLKKNVQSGVTGPVRVVKMIGGKGVKAIDEQSLFNTNTRDEWDAAMELATANHVTPSDPLL